MKINNKIKPVGWSLLVFVMLMLVACEPGQLTPTVYPVTPSITTLPSTTQPALTQEQLHTLASLEKIDEYPLYTMHYYADYASIQNLASSPSHDQRKLNPQEGKQGSVEAWGCSLFAAFGDVEHPLFGRNFDWRYSPALLLYSQPKAGNASVSLVDIQYLVGEDAESLLELPIEQRLPLLDAPAWPFDGMNACGLVIGMAAVPFSDGLSNDPQKDDIDSLGIMRQILDQTCTVDEALALLDSYNILWEGGPELHYLIAEASGRAVLVEYYQGAMQVIPNQEPWHQATNFLISGTGTSTQGVCNRYDAISAFMQETSGNLSSQQAMSLLSQVSQENTQWSAVYDPNHGVIRVVMGRDYRNPHSFHLDMQP